MKKNHFFARHTLFGLALMGLGAVVLGSCAQDGFDDKEKFETVTNTTLGVPGADDIVVMPDASGARQTISWPVVYGAGGYIVSLYDVSDPEKPVVISEVENKLVDACQIVVERKEDVYYKFVIRTAANEAKNNKESATAMEKTYSTFMATYKEIPAGTDLTAYFAENPLPADRAAEDLCFDLVAGGNYTMSGVVDAGLNKITLRCTNKTNRPKVELTGAEAGFVMSSGLTLKNLNFDCAASEAPFVAMTKKAGELGIAAVNGNFFINDKLNIQSCNITNVPSYFVFDNRVKVYVKDVIVNNCVVHLAPNAAYDAVFWLNKGGFISDLAVTNSTFYRTGANDYKYFYQTGGRAKNVNLAKNSVTYANSTFCNIAANGQWGNYNGMAGQSNSYWNMTDCIFYNCSSSGVARRFLAGRTKQTTAIFKNNTYMHADGTFDNPAGYDDSGTDIKSDPMFKDAANADFTIGGSTQVSMKTGDPRWLP